MLTQQHVHDLAGKYKSHRNVSPALLNGGHELIESRIKAERQNSDDAIVRSDSQIIRDYGASRHHLLVTEHHAFGLAGRTRSVQDGGQILADSPIAPILSRGQSEKFRQIIHGLATSVAFSFVTHYDKLQRSRLFQDGQQRSYLFSRSDQTPHLAIIGDMSDLAREKKTVDRHKHASSLRHTKN